MIGHEFSVVGTRRPRVDAGSQVTGRTVFADDIALPGMLVGRLLRSPHGHARIIRIDATRARSLEGVAAVLTGTDLPVAYGILPVSQDEHTLAVDRVRYIGEPVAAVAAVDADTAARALELIEVEYTPLEETTTLWEAAEARHLIHGEGVGPNIHRSAALEFGDVAAGFEEADHVREDLYDFRGSTHAALEQHSAVAAHGPDGRLTIWSSTQVPHYLQRALEKVLEMPAGAIRVVATPVGGGFGGKTDPFSHEIAAARLSIETGRPVKITLTREEVFYTHRGRHPVLIWLRTGFRKDGTITAMHLRTHLDGGAFGSYGAATLYYTGALQPATYRISNYKFEGVRGFTNKPPCGPKRGHGTPQPRFAVECQLDAAAGDLGLDPVTIRMRNLVEPYSMTVNHLRITSCGLRECLDEAVAASGFREKHGNLPHGRGIGLAVGAYLSGAGLPIYFNDMPQSEVTIKVDRGGGVTVFSMAADVGQGSTSMLATVVGEVLGLDPAALAVVTADTDLTPVDLGSYSSRVTFMAGNAALQAAENVRSRVFEVVADELGTTAEVLVAEDGRIGVEGAPDKSMSWEEAVRAAVARGGPLMGSGAYRAPDLAGPYKGSGVGISPAYSFSVAVVEVECDADTGQVQVDRVWLAHDVGRALNPLLVEGQIEGGVYMGLGEALMEEQAFRGALHRGPSLLDYKMPTFLDMPPVESILIESVDPEGPFGAKEVGQGPLLPVIPAVANAIHDALGVRIDEVPITPDKVVRALRDLAKGGSGRVGPDGIPAFDYGRLIRVDPPEGFGR
jgi:4-hydroxybenzoyl-CoA reductase alpha subunit